jgi:hypothetical protein
MFQQFLDVSVKILENKTGYVFVNTVMNAQKACAEWTNYVTGFI